MISVEVCFFAAFRDQAGHAETRVQTDATTVAELFAECRAAAPALEPYVAMKYAINDELVGADARLHDGDRVLFFPPVAGG